MTQVRLWWHGARPRTLPAAVSPVIVGTGAAAVTSSEPWGWQEYLMIGLCALVALALQVGVNYANDYSDGVRGTDAERVGPVRLVGQGLVPAHLVRRAAFITFGVAAVAGLILVVLSGQWWLLLVGAAAIAAAWYYTGGSRPYGYAGWGEVSVFVFFGLVAVMGTAAVLSSRVSLLSFVVAVPVGLLASALLVVNNLRDIPTDEASGKRTLATRLGDHSTRTLYVGMIWLPFVIVVLLAASATVLPDAPAWSLLALVATPLAAVPARAVRNGAKGPTLVKVLGETARLELAFSALLGLGLVLSALT